jgi:hypothetical protein
MGEIIADNLSKAGWSWGCLAAVDSSGRTIWIADAHRGDGKRFVVRSNEANCVCRTRISDSRRQLSNLASYEVGLSNSICAAAQPSQQSETEQA